MPVLQANLSLKRSAVVNDDPDTNGGALSSVAAGTTLFPDVSGIERETGISRWRKVFLKNEAGTGALPNRVSDPLLFLTDSKLYLANTTAAGDHFLIKAAEYKSGVQSDETNTGWSGAGSLVALADVDEVTFDVLCEIDGTGGEVFADGGRVLISYGGLKEFLTLDDPGGVSWTGTTATLTFTSTPLQHQFPAALTALANIRTLTSVGNSGLTMTVNEHAGRRVRITTGTGMGQKRRIVSNTATTLTIEYNWTTELDGTSEFTIDLTEVSQCVLLGSIGSSYTAPTYSPGCAGTLTPGITVYPVGAIDDTWTLNFSGQTTFTITSASGLALGEFSVGNEIKPAHGASFYFMISAGAFGGTFQNGDWVQFSTVSASAAAWIKQTVPALTAAHLANSVDIGASGDTL